MTLTTEQAVAMRQRPRMSEAEVGQMVSLRADGYTAKQIAEQFPQYAEGTVFNKLSSRKAQVEDLRKARSVQFKDIPGVRKPARVNDYWELRTMYKFLIQKHYESCFAADPVSGVLEFVEQLVDVRRLKVYSDQLHKANRAIEAEMGQQIAPLPAVGEVALSRQVSGVDGAGGLDYKELVRRRAEWAAAAPERERAAAVREEWKWRERFERYRRVSDPLTAQEQLMKEKDRESGMSPSEADSAAFERYYERKREANYDNFERFVTDRIVELWTEYGVDGVSADDLAADVKYSLPQDDGVWGEVDAWFAGGLFARMVEAARRPAPALEPEAVPVPDRDDPSVPPSEPAPDGQRWEWKD